MIERLLYVARMHYQNVCAGIIILHLQLVLPCIKGEPIQRWNGSEHVIVVTCSTLNLKIIQILNKNMMCAVHDSLKKNSIQ